MLFCVWRDESSKKKPAKTRKYDIRSCIDNSKNGIFAEYKCRRCHSNPSHAFLSETFTFFFHFNLRTMLMCTHPKLYDSLDRETIETHTYTRFQYMSGWSACGVTSTNCDWWLKQFRSIKFGCNRNPSLSFYSQSIVIIISIFFIHRLQSLIVEINIWPPFTFHWPDLHIHGWFLLTEQTILKRFSSVLYDSVFSLCYFSDAAFTRHFRHLHCEHASTSERIPIEILL